MKGHARIELIEAFSQNILTIKVPEEQKSFIRDLVNYSMQNPGTEMNISIEGRGLIEPGPRGLIALHFTDNPFTRIEKITNRRTLTQNSTLRGIERFIFIAENGYEPTKDDLYWIHEGILEKYSTWNINPRTGISTPKRTSDPSMSTTEMAKIIDGALNSLAVMDIPKEVLDSIGHDMKTLWESWYAWRYTQERDPLFDAENEVGWEKYQELHPVCELCSLPGTDFDPLERMHIVSAGASKGIYEKPWNWLRAHHSHHALQHNEGWEIIEKSYPHIKGKIRRARLMEGEYNAS